MPAIRHWVAPGPGWRRAAFRAIPPAWCRNAASPGTCLRKGLAKDSYVAAQGRCTGADGQVDCRQEADGTVWIGGRAAMIAAGADLTLGG